MKLGKTLLLPTMLSLLPVGLHANNIQVKHVALREGIAGSYGVLEFDLSWENSWRNDLEGAGRAAPFNYDAAWVFVKFSTDGGATWRHATLSNNSSDHRILKDNGVPAILKAVPQGTGIFIFRERNGAGAIDWRDVQLRWQYEAGEVSSLTSPVIAKVIALEMVFIPSGGFFAGDLNPQVVNGQFEEGDSGKP